ncbi:MAG: hypothetical protein AAGF31_12960 [Planctomycetota bacterium]
MAVAAPTNCWTEAEADIGAALPQLDAWRSLCRVTTAEAAARHVFGEKVGEPIDGEALSEDEILATGTYAMVYSTSEQPYRLARVRTRQLIASGQAILFIEHLVTENAAAEAEEPLELERTFKNDVGDLMEQLVAYFDTHGGPQINSIEVEAGPGWNHSDDWPTEGRRVGASLLIAWGRDAQ